MEPMQDSLKLNEFSYLILGGGYFGQKAVEKILGKLNQKDRPLPDCLHKRETKDEDENAGQAEGHEFKKRGKIWLVDKSADCLSFSLLQGKKREGLYGIIAEASDFLDIFLSLDYVTKNPDKIMIVPAVPFHLAADWLIRSLQQKNGVAIKRIPLEIPWDLPFEYLDPPGNRYVSMATWRCAENCLPSPGHCTLTHNARPKDLFDLIREKALETGEFEADDIRVIISKQLAPGLGAYHCSDLFSLRELALKPSGGEKKILVATSCTCHGVATALKIESA